MAVGNNGSVQVGSFKCYCHGRPDGSVAVQIWRRGVLVELFDFGAKHPTLKGGSATDQEIAQDAVDEHCADLLVKAAKEANSHRDFYRRAMAI